MLTNLLVIFLLGLKGLGVGQNCPPFPSDLLGRSVVNLGVYFRAGFLGVAPPAGLDSVVLSPEVCFFLVLRVEIESYVNFRFRHRASHLVVHLGWVDLDFECSTLCPFLIGLIKIRQKRLYRWTSMWNT